MRLKALALAVCSFAVLSAMQMAIAQDVKPMKSPYAEVLQRISTTDVKITYHRPAVKNRVIWGELVPFGGEKPWRAGANDATTFSVNKDVKINGKSLPAGNYTFYVFVDEEESTLVFNKVEKAWGSYEYDAEKDALRIKVAPEEADHQERLLYGFEDLTDNTATAFLHWEKARVTFKIEAE